MPQGYLERHWSVETEYAIIVTNTQINIFLLPEQGETTLIIVTLTLCFFFEIFDQFVSKNLKRFIKIPKDIYFLSKKLVVNLRFMRFKVKFDHYTIVLLLSKDLRSTI